MSLKKTLGGEYGLVRQPEYYYEVAFILPVA